MEEAEIPTEKIQEHLEHHAHETGDKWNSWIALSTAILAGFAAVTALLAGDHANEAMIDQMRASDQWSYYQAKGIKAGVLAAKMDLLKASGHAASAADTQKAAQYIEDQKRIEDLANEKQKSSEDHLARHVILARGVTMFQIAIAIAAISALTKRRRFWIVSLCFGAIGLVFLLQEVVLRFR
jgi:hypothetical protein